MSNIIQFPRNKKPQIPRIPVKPEPLEKNDRPLVSSNSSDDWTYSTAIKSMQLILIFTVSILLGYGLGRLFF